MFIYILLLLIISWLCIFFSSQYIRRCSNCQKNKHSIHRKYEEIQYQTSSKASWKKITMNFIMKLSLSMNSTTNENYDSILVMIDRLTKYSHIISFKKTYSAKQLKYIVLNKLIKYHELSKEIINNRNKLFTFNYWKTLISLLNVKLRLFTAYHSEIDDQTERTNQSFEQYLRHYVNKTQNNWVELLFMTQLTLNSKMSNTTKITSFFVNFEKKSNLFEHERSHLFAQSALNRVKTLKNIHANISRMQEKFTKYWIDKRKIASQLKKRDKVYLLIKNLKTRRSSKKLNHVKVESFFIKRMKKSVNYELNLSKNVKIHSMFHVSLLKSTNSSTFIQNTFHYEVQEENEFEVEEILQQNDQRYLIKWKEYSISKNTWEFIENLRNCQKKLKKFRQKKNNELSKVRRQIDK